MATPVSGLISISDLSSQLAGENNLGYYRGRTYYNATSGAAVVISQSPAMSEFYNLTNAPPSNAVLPFITVNGGAGSVVAVPSALFFGLIFNLDGSIGDGANTTLTNIQARYKNGAQASPLWTRAQKTAGNGACTFIGAGALTTGVWSAWVNTTVTQSGQICGLNVSAPAAQNTTANVMFQASADGSAVAATSGTVTFSVTKV